MATWGYLAFGVAAGAMLPIQFGHYAWVGFAEHPITPGRVLGVALVAFGVALVRVFQP